MWLFSRASLLGIFVLAIKSMGPKISHEAGHLCTNTCVSARDLMWGLPVKVLSGCSGQILTPRSWGSDVPAVEQSGSVRE